MSKILKFFIKETESEEPSNGGALSEIVENKSTVTGTGCKICNREFANQEALNSHNAAKHNGKISSSGPKTNNSSYKIFGALIIMGILFAGVLFMNSGTDSSTGSVVSDGSGVQKITLGFRNGYTPNTLIVKANQPVELTLDNSIGGCYRSFNIRDLGVSGYSQGPSQTIKFTPTEKGKFTFACGMGMARGTIIVE